MEDTQQASVGAGRMVSIDILRGIAILWVVLFHLWGDLEYFPGVPREYYQQLWFQLEENRSPWAVITSVTDLVFRKGFQGVPLFMMISGLSLTIAAYRAGDGLRWPAFTYARFRKLLVPYIVGVALTYLVIVLIAWRQASINDATFASQFTGGVTISEKTVLHIDGGVVFASLTLLPRLVEDSWFFAPQLALWFVGLLAQYYLLFPLLFFAMRRFGVAALLLATFAVTVGANAWAVNQYGALELKFFLVTGWAPFRLFEFTAGMALGWLLIDPRGRKKLELVRHPMALAAAIGFGLAAMVVGDLLIGWWTADQIIAQSNILYLQAIALPLVTLGLAFLSVPLLVRRPSRVDVTVPVRAVVALGVMSYALLIVSDAMRLVASQLLVEDVSAPVWWTFLVAVYVPVSILIAWPLARVLGLMPVRRPAPGPSLAAVAPAPVPTGATSPVRGETPVA
jgi:peptidoglycan/LPS O-acetylase OafA/YrhL